MEVTLSLILSAMVFKVSLVETKPIDGQKPGNSGLRKKILIESNLSITALLVWISEACENQFEFATFSYSDSVDE
nr:putative phosphoglucomutase, cytoplasmic 1 [Quercus suber]